MYFFDYLPFLFDKELIHSTKSYHTFDSVLITKLIIILRNINKAVELKNLFIER